MSEDKDVVLYKVEERVATITLNRRERMNAITAPVRTGVLEAFMRASADEKVRAIILTGAGEAFCAGGDTKEMRKAVLEKGAGYNDTEHKVMPLQNKAILAMHRTEKPIIAAVNGPCAGGGMGMALACDIRIASTKAVFSAAFSRIGLCPEWGMTYYLPRIVGEDRAKEIVWLGERIFAEEAHELGIVTKLTSPETLMPTVSELAKTLAARPPYSVRLSKKGLSRSLVSSIDDMLDFESFSRIACLASEDFKEGVAARAEKREPDFKGR